MDIVQKSKRKTSKIIVNSWDKFMGEPAKEKALEEAMIFAQALMPKIQELQRYWVHQVEDHDATPLGYSSACVLRQLICNLPVYHSHNIHADQSFEMPSGVCWKRRSTEFFVSLTKTWTAGAFIDSDLLISFLMSIEHGLPFAALCCSALDLCTFVWPWWLSRLYLKVSSPSLSRQALCPGSHRRFDPWLDCATFGNAWNSALPDFFLESRPA